MLARRWNWLGIIWAFRSVGTFVLIVGEIGPSAVQFAVAAGIGWWSEQRSLEDVVGEIFVEIELENIEDRNLDACRGSIAEEACASSETVRAVADTGAMMLALPEDRGGTRLGVSRRGLDYDDLRRRAPG